MPYNPKSLKNLNPAKKGEVRNPNGITGLKSKFITIKNCFCDAFDVEEFLAWAKDNPDKFYDCLMKLMPKELTIDGELKQDLNISVEELKKKNIGELIGLFRESISKNDK